jgi:NADPH-dependent curcumin reductase CurA
MSQMTQERNKALAAQTEETALPRLNSAELALVKPLASGPVGSLVGQFAKLSGARAVGIAGAPEKWHAAGTGDICFSQCEALGHRASGLVEARGGLTARSA